MIVLYHQKYNLILVVFVLLLLIELKPYIHPKEIKRK